MVHSLIMHFNKKMCVPPHLLIIKNLNKKSYNNHQKNKYNRNFKLVSYVLARLILYKKSWYCLRSD